MKIGGRQYTRAQLCERIGNIAQLGGTRHVVLNEGKSKGVAAIDVDTGTGFTCTVLPDRGLDISRASYNGIGLAFLTANGEVHPAYYDRHGAGWLRNFFAGLLTTCGLTNIGAPCMDVDEEIGLHGRYTNLPAQRVQDRSGWDGDEYRVEITGTIDDTVLFGEKLRLVRTITTQIGRRGFTIHDRVENVGNKTSPFTILYHINPGFPLVDATSELVATVSKTEPVDERAAQSLDKWHCFSDPIPGFEEICYLHTAKPDKNGIACAAMLNRGLAGGLGLCVRWDTTTLPYLNQWKMMGQMDYVVGIEPCNSPCKERSVVREAGLLPFLKPGETREMNVDIDLLVGAAEIDACAKACGR
ncbi:MAG: aldose 1-epimerase family protein [Verrucomicrobia bacterium]|nr:aldose 1-epimerase family protein [Verrucomicrobiota bacterium]